MIVIYLKTHNQTGLKYLGKTKNDPFKYKGSGVRWLNHLKVHGNDVTTIVLQTCENNEEVKCWGLHYSKLWNIVEDSSFANLMEEKGDGGPSYRSDIINAIVSKKLKEYNESLDSEYKKRRASNAGRKFWDMVKDDPILANKMSNIRKLQINPMQGKKQKRACCICCKKDLPVNQIPNHKCN